MAVVVDNPPPQNTVVVTYSELVRKADPQWYRDYNWSVEYEFSNDKKFYANPQQRGAYTP